MNNTAPVVRVDTELIERAVVEGRLRYNAKSAELREQRYSIMKSAEQVHVEGVFAELVSAIVLGAGFEGDTVITTRGRKQPDIIGKGLAFEIKYAERPLLVVDASRHLQAQGCVSHYMLLAPALYTPRYLHLPLYVEIVGVISWHDFDTIKTTIMRAGIAKYIATRKYLHNLDRVLRGHK